MRPRPSPVFILVLVWLLLIALATGAQALTAQVGWHPVPEASDALSARRARLTTLTPTATPALAATAPLGDEQPPHTGFIPPATDLSHLTGQKIPGGLRAAAELPSEWDWREHGGVTPVKDRCGAGAIQIRGQDEPARLR
jgi:hypothetical protein